MTVAGEKVKKESRKQKKRRGPASTDRHRLYENSVQSPKEHIEFFERVYKDKNGHPARVLKEDFCGTAFLSAAWVQERDDNIAVGVDLDEETLAWAQQHNIDPLGGAAKRVTLHAADVRELKEPKAEILAALNFSYFGFKTRDDLREYLEQARSSLTKDGMLILDIFGGTDAQSEELEETRYDGYTYVWEQKSFDPITNETVFYIHFKFHGPTGGGIKKAFTYEWRLWSLPEVTELLKEAGYEHIDIYWEGIDEETGEGDGEFTLVTHAESSQGWIAFIVAW